MSEAEEEAARLNALCMLNLLDTPPSETFDRITRTAARLFNLPIAAVSLTDRERQWFKSRIGVEHNSIPRHKAPCAEVAVTKAFVAIPDLSADPCYATSVLASQGIRFYAGAPLLTREGYALGALCVLGTEPREILDIEIEALSDLAKMVMSQVELQHAFGRVDPVSGLPNRTQFFDDLDDLARDQPGAQRLAVLVDLARIEQISSGTRVMGSGYIDSLVRIAAKQIRTELGSSRQAYHVGSTQFAYLAPAGVDVSAYRDLLEAKLKKIEGESELRFLMTAAIGVAPFVVGRSWPSDVLRMAHSAALDARFSEAAVVTYSFERDFVHRRRFDLLSHFGSALEADEDQLRLVYQPRVDLATGRCIGAEALLRWENPTLGNISPGEFIPIVEQTSLARPTTAWVFENAIEQLGAWHAEGTRISLSVNVSACNLEESDLAEHVQLLLLKHRVRPEYLELELTESAVMQNGGNALWQLKALHAAGVRLAIDDFWHRSQ